jgi:tetratricopeptide (TPR) repeat protein
MRQMWTIRTARAGRQAGSSAALLAALLALPVLAQQAGAQDSGKQSSSSGQGTQQKQPPAHTSSAGKDSGAQRNSAAQENPFPEDVSKQAAQPQGNQPGDAPAAPKADQQGAQKPGDAAKENPFPEDVSKGAAAAASKDNDGGASSSSSSSSSNPSGDADANVDPNADLPRDTGRRKLKKPSEKDIQSGSLAGQGEAQDDIRVGRFYLGTKNYQGAYGRFSEATRMDPANADAIYGLAAAAAGLHHTDEALTNYKLYLQIAPDGNDAKSARKAIQSLSK